MSIFMLAQAQDGAAAPAAPVTTATESVPAGQPAPEQPNIFEQIFGGPMFMFVVIIILFWVMLIRPQRKAQKEQQAKQRKKENDIRKCEEKETFTESCVQVWKYVIRS